MKIRNIITITTVLLIVGSLFASTAYTDWLFKQLYGEQRVEETTICSCNCCKSNI